MTVFRRMNLFHAWHPLSPLVTPPLLTWHIRGLQDLPLTAYRTNINLYDQAVPDNGEEKVQSSAWRVVCRDL